MVTRIASLVLCALFLAMDLAALAQQPKKVARIGFLSTSHLSANTDTIEAFRQGLRELGYVESKNVVVEWRSAEGNFDRTLALAAELVKLKVDVIVTAGPIDTRAAKNATSTIPIVMAQEFDPVGAGLVSSLARPGGNITGTAILAPELAAKRLELLREIIPKLTRVAVLGMSTNPGNAQTLSAVEKIANGLNVQLQYVEIADPSGIEAGFQSARQGRADAILVLGSPILNSHRKQFSEFAARVRIPAMFDRAGVVEDGGLIAYGVSRTENFRRAATFVDKILKGRKPADLPVEQPMRFELVVNQQTAKRLGLSIPPEVLVRADRVIK